MINDYNPSPYIAEYFSLYYRPVNVYPLDRTTTQVDSLYGEAKDRVYTTPITIPIYFRFDVDEKTLTKFGIDRKEDLFVVISYALVQNAGWDPQPGDRVEIDGEHFEITFLKPQYDFNGSVYLYVGTAKRWQSG